MSLAGALLSGDVRALARAISLAEDRDPQASQLVAELQPHTGNAYLVGLTGAPGTGKSTLADALVKVIRDRRQTVGVIAVDPSSPFTGGAVAATFGIRWVFVVTASLLLANLLWVWLTVPEPGPAEA